MDNLTVTFATLGKVLTRLYPARGNDNARLKGLLLELHSDHAVLMATDSYILAALKTDLLEPTNPQACEEFATQRLALQEEYASISIPAELLWKFSPNALVQIRATYQSGVRSETASHWSIKVRESSGNKIKEGETTLENPHHIDWRRWLPRAPQFELSMTTPDQSEFGLNPNYLVKAQKIICPNNPDAFFPTLCYTKNGAYVLPNSTDEENLIIFIAPLRVLMEDVKFVEYQPPEF